jgi:hypothetical protein
MDVHPPIPERTTDQLLEIIETKEEWQPKVVELASAELLRRGIPLKNLETRRTIKRSFKARIGKIKSRATYTPIEKFLIVIFGPALVIILRDPFLFHSGEGYKKKNRQGFFYLFLGIFLWVMVLYYCN